MILRNLQSLICLLLATAVGAAFRSMFPFAPARSEWLIASAVALILGYVSEWIKWQPHVLNVPLTAITACTIPFAIWQVLGLAWFFIAALLALELGWLILATRESLRWDRARQTLFEYERLGGAEPDLHAAMLERALYQNLWTPANEAQIRHNKRVISHLMWDPAVRLAETEILLLQDLRARLDNEQGLLLLGWQMRDIGELKRLLLVGHPLRSANLRISV